MAGQDYPVIGDQNNLMTAPGPGASVANTLQAILAQRRAQRQQDIIDQVSQQKADQEGRNIDSEISYRADQAATNAANRQSQADTRAQQTQDRANTQKRLQAISDYASSQYPDDPVESEMWRIIEHDPERYEQLSQAILTRKEQRASAKTPGFLYTIDRATGKVTKTDVQDPAGNKYEVTGEQPRQPSAANVPDTYLHPEPDPRDPSGQTYEDVPYVMTPEEYQKYGFSNPAYVQKGFVRGAGGPGHRKLTSEPNPKPAPDIISAQDASKLASLRKDATAETGGFLGFGAHTDPTKVAAYKQELASIIGRSRVHPNVRATVLDAEQEYPTMPIEEIIATKLQGIPPAELEEFRSLMHIVRGEVGQ